jgi:endonuclease/exonuclease/phosphatase family metal-dependent hydrolase
MRPCFLCLVFLLTTALAEAGVAAETFRIATYNVENYLDAASGTRRVKPDDAKGKVRESIVAMRPDVLALEEIGQPSALAELQSSLKHDGVDLPFAQMFQGYDTNVHVAVLSRFPFASVTGHTNDTFLLAGRRFRVSRGFGQVEIKPNTNYTFTLMVAHLKSKRQIGQADQADLRLEEAKILREKVDAVFAANPNANLIVLGDLNDSKGAPSTKAIIGKGKHKLVDTRPCERNGDTAHATKRGSATVQRNITWTEYYAEEDIYSRFDYILLSPGMAREWVQSETYLLALPDWGIASDHRPLLATFQARDN